MRKHVFLIVIALTLGINLRSEEPKALPATTILQETLKTFQEEGEVTAVWWVPKEYFENTVARNPRTSAEEKKAFVKEFEDYSIFFMLSGKNDGSALKTKTELLATAELKVGGVVIKPIEDGKLAAGPKDFITAIKPTLASALGKVGNGMEFIVYPNKKDGKLILDATAEGTFNYTLCGKVFQWRLPLATVLPRKTDSETGESFPGNYKFNPYTGKKLVDK